MPQVQRTDLHAFSYVKSDVLGKGYTSVVMRGRQERTGQAVAVKFVEAKKVKGQVQKKLLSSQIKVLGMFRGIQTASDRLRLSKRLTETNYGEMGTNGLDHVIRLHAVYQEDSGIYIVTEICQGGDFAELLKNRSRKNGGRGLSELDAEKYMRQIVAGYREIQKRSVIHRDLKPANIFLKDDILKIADFGFAIQSSEANLHVSYNVGSPVYMPYEALHANNYTFKSDIWALGVIYYEMLTSRTPWRAKNETDLKKMIKTVSISKLLPTGISQFSRQFLTRSLSFNLSERMSPDELYQHFKLDEQSSCEDKLSYLKTACNSEDSLPQDTSVQRSIDKNIFCNNQIKGSYNRPGRAMASIQKNIADTTNHQTRNAGAITHMPNNSLHETVTPKVEANPVVKVPSLAPLLLSQLHFCRFVFKLISRMKKYVGSLKGKGFIVSSSLFEDLEELVMGKLKLVKACGLEGCLKEDWKVTDQASPHSERNHDAKNDQKLQKDWKQIAQLATRYETRYKEAFGRKTNTVHDIDLEDLNKALNEEVRVLYAKTNHDSYKRSDNPQDALAAKSSIYSQLFITIDYMLTLQQLISVLARGSMRYFHKKVDMEAIAEGVPVETVEAAHVEAIIDKMKTCGIQITV